MANRYAKPAEADLASEYHPDARIAALYADLSAIDSALSRVNRETGNEKTLNALLDRRLGIEERIRELT